MNSSDLFATSTLFLFILYDSTFGGVLSARLLQERLVGARVVVVVVVVVGARVVVVSLSSLEQEL